MGTPKILVVGSLVMDLIVSTSRFPERGETVLGLDHQITPGGKGANQAVQAAKLGAQVTMVGKVGRDAFGDALLKSAEESGVNVAHVGRTTAAPSAVGNVQLEIQENSRANRIIVVSGANMEIQPEDVTFLKDTIGQYDMVMLQLEIPLEINILVAGYAAAQHVPVMLNSAPYHPLPEELLNHITYLSPNEHEAKLLTCRDVNDDEGIRSALMTMKDMGVAHPLITLGSRGVAGLTEQGEMVLCPAIADIKVKDTTAAGDSFVAAFCTCICAGVGSWDSLVFANHTAALTVCRMGAQPSLPTKVEVLEFLESRGVDTGVYTLLNEGGHHE